MLSIVSQSVAFYQFKLHEHVKEDVLTTVISVLSSILLVLAPILANNVVTYISLSYRIFIIFSFCSLSG